MHQLTLAGRRSDARRLIAALQQAGVVHVTPVQAASSEGERLQLGALSGPEADTRKRFERLLARSEGALGELGGTYAPAPLPPEADWEAAVEAAAQPVAELNTQRTALDGDLGVAQSFGDVVARLAELSVGLERSPRLAVLPFTLDDKTNTSELEAALRADLQDRWALDTAPVGQNLRAGVLVVRAAERGVARTALSRARIGELRLPGRFDGLPLSEAAGELAALKNRAPTELTRMRAELDTIGRQAGGTLVAIRSALRDIVGVYDVQAQSARGQYGFVVQGFVPDEHMGDLQRALKPFEGSVVLETSPVDGHHAEQVPVKITNGSYVRNFQFLLNISDPPRYGTFDPSWVVAVFFPLFFGFIVADIGFGLIFLLTALWAMARSKRGESLPIGLLGITLDPGTLYQVAYVLRTMSLWSILWGFFTGEFFGNVLEKHIHLFYVNPDLIKRLWGVTLGGEHEGGIIPILFPRTDSAFANTIMILCILVGIVYLFWAWGLRAQLSLKHRHMNHFWEAVGILGGLVGLVLLGFISQAGRNFGALSNFSNPAVWIMLAGFAVFLLGLILSRAFLMLIEILSQGGFIISFTRLFAVGVAAAILANLATDLGWSLGGVLPVIGPILGILIGLIVHTFLFALTILGHIMQPLRLHWVEYLNPTGYYQESGPRYTPFARSSGAGK